MGTIESIQQDIVNEFDFFDDWSEKYQYLIDLGKKLPDFSEINRIDDNLVKGCQSNVWLHAEIIDDKIIYTADSDAIISKGIISILISVFSGQKPDDIVKAKMDFIDKIGLSNHLSQTRANGLLSMVKQIKLYAVAYNSKK
ncbi:MAG TPA: SufE family protein [Flavobacteriaceae bacterium]|nr:SufE family protein [Flavobacteriaceae bacterium]